MNQFIFNQLDSWCFREARPMGSVGGTAISSLFPPPASTLIGACRTLIGDSQGIDWRAFAKGESPKFNALLGNGEHCGQLRFSAPYIRVKKNNAWLRLYPVPAVFVQHGTELSSLSLSDNPVECDLGNVKLPQLASNVGNAKPLEECWLTEVGLHACLHGKVPQLEDIVSLADIITRENRLGIARDNETASVLEGHLYQTEHIRLAEAQRFEQIELVVEVSGLPDDIAIQLQEKHQQIRLGGEGRLAHVTVAPCQAKNLEATLTNSALLYCISPADLNGWLPAEFTPISQHGIDCWQADIDGIEVTIEALCAGKPTKLGGWDSAKRQPKPVKSLLPMGACFFIKANDLQKLQQKLMTHRFGEQTDFGYGEMMLLPSEIN